MDRDTAFIALCILLTHAATASQINLEVSPEVGVEHFGTEHYNKTESLQRINVTAENSGSADCLHALKADIRAADRRYTKYTQPRDLMSGSAIASRLIVSPLNYTGRVNLNLSATYCDRTTQITQLSYNHTDRLIAEQEFNSTTLRATDSSAEFRLSGVENATLVPLEAPPVWKVGSTEVVRGKATARYEPSVFHPSRNITYTVFQGDEALGTTKVSLRAGDEPGLIEQLTNPDIVAASLLLNVLLSLVLVAAYRQSLKQALAKLSWWLGP